jgi:hypothetical protein
VSARVRARLIRGRLRYRANDNVAAYILQGKVKPDGLAIVIEPDHFRMYWRDETDAQPRMSNGMICGSSVKDSDLRRGFRRCRASRTVTPQTHRRGSHPGTLAVCKPHGRACFARGAAQDPSQSKAKTSRSGIAGVLGSSGRAFLPLPEGGRMPANALYNQRAADARCHGVVILSCEESSERRFAGGSMGWVNLQRLNPSPLLKCSAGVTFDLCSVTGKASMAHLDELTARASTKDHGTLTPSAAS